MSGIDRSKMRLGESRFMGIFRPFLSLAPLGWSPPPTLFYISDEPEEPEDGDDGLEELIDWLIAMDGTIIRTILIGLGIGIPILSILSLCMRNVCQSKDVLDPFKRLLHFSNIDFCKQLFEEKKP